MTINPAHNHQHRFRARLVWGELGRALTIQDRTPLDYFLLLYPMTTIADTIKFTNQRLAAQQCSSMSQTEFLHWLGIRLRMAVCPLRGGLEVYWKGASDDPTPVGGIDFSPIMSFSRFTVILNCLAFCEMRAGISVNDVS